MRVGHGYDAHRFSAGRELVIGGIHIDYQRGLEAHSDGDVLVHALMDAMLGAAGERDIGYQFPDKDGKYKNIDSCILLKTVSEMISDKGFTVEYCDMTVIAQEPKLSGYIIPMRETIASILGVSSDRVNVKATTEEKMGFTGQLEGIAAHAVCLLNE